MRGRPYYPCPGIAGLPCLGTGHTAFLALACLDCRRFRCACGDPKPRRRGQCQKCDPANVVPMLVPDRPPQPPCAECGQPKRTPYGTLCAACSRKARVVKHATGRSITFDDTPAELLALAYGYGLHDDLEADERPAVPSRLADGVYRVALR